MTHYILYSDGAARGNPGPAGAGAVIFNDSGDVIEELRLYLGKTTNNIAEYKALLIGLKKLVELNASSAEVRADSELMVKQLKGEYRVKHPNLIPLYQEAKLLIRQIPKFQVKHVYREDNKHADRLSNEAIDQR